MSPEQIVAILARCYRGKGPFEGTASQGGGAFQGKARSRVLQALVLPRERPVRGYCKIAMTIAATSIGGVTEGKARSRVLQDAPYPKMC